MSRVVSAPGEKQPSEEYIYLKPESQRVTGQLTGTTDIKERATAATE